MLSSPVHFQLVRWAGLAIVYALAGCGGGGGGGETGTNATAQGVAAAQALNPAAVASSTVDSSGTSSSNVTIAASDSLATPSNSTTVGVALALSAASSVVMQGVADRPVVTVPTPNAVVGRVFHVDSALGNDANDGLSSAGASAGHGPWRSLARVSRSDLGPGDALQLACGSVWNETLRLPASGTAAQPLLVGASTPGCAAPPVIDGSTSLPGAAWLPHQGNVYKTPLDSVPLLLTSATSTVWTEAHHPNRGYLSSDTSSPYLAAAAESDVVTVNGQSGSTSLYTGADLVMPPGAQLGPEARVGIRVFAWWLEEHKVTAVEGNRISFDQPTWFPVGAGRGYYLLGQLWMADSPGEWYYDAAAKQLYAYMPDATAPTALRAVTMATGIDLQGLAYVVVDGVAVRRVGTGADLRGSSHVTIRNASFTDIANFGADVTASTAATIESNAYTRIGADAVSGWRLTLTAASGMSVRSNVVRDSGVQLAGDTVLTLPRFSYAAIYGGTGSTISGNVVVNSGYIGIQAQANSLIENNFVYGACSVLDDCGGIYTQYANNNSIIRGNTVVHARGALAGKPATEAHTAAQGIYLDESVSGALVQNNTVIDADNGVQLHVSSHNTISGNRLYGNRRAQIWMQANRNVENATGDLIDNLVVDNQIAPVSPSAVGIWLDTSYASTSAFGTIDRNHYFDRTAPVAVVQSTSAGLSEYSFAQWQSTASTTLPAGRDAHGAAASATGYAWYRVSGSNLVSNSLLSVNSAGWSAWNATTPYGLLMREACPPGTCLRYVAGASQGLVSAPNFSVQAGRWYRLSIDLAGGEDKQPMTVVVRRGGGGANGYDSVTASDFAVTLNRNWQRYTRVFQATTTVNANDPVTGDLGARIDVAPVLVGKSVSIANVELVPITPDATAQISGALVNVSSAPRSWDCPFASSQPALCPMFRRMDDDSPLSWPASVPAYAAVLIYAQEPSLIDSDSDGIADALDSCPDTPAGLPVNAAGCPLKLH